MEVPQKIKIELPYDPVIPLLNIYLGKPIIQKIHVNQLYFNNNKKRDTCTLMFIAALFTVVKTGKKPKSPSIHKWIKKIGTHIQWTITQP